MKLGKFSIATKVIIFAVILIILFCVILGWFFVNHEITAIRTELDARANTIARNLAYNSEYSVLVGDEQSLTYLIAGVLEEKDIVYVNIENDKGKTIIQVGEKGKEPTKEFTAAVSTKLFGDEAVEFIPEAREEKEEVIGWVRLGVSLFNLQQKTSELISFVSLIVLIVILTSTSGVILGIRFLITRPLVPLLSTIKKLGKGDLSQRVAVNTRDEIGELAQSFNRMAEDLSKTHVSKTYVDNILKSMMDTLIVVNPDGIIKKVNEATKNSFGYKENELIGKPVDVLFTENQAFNRSVFPNLLQKGTIINKEITCLAKDGRKIPVLFSASAMYNNDASIQGIVCIASDITERKRAEEALKESEKKYRTLVESAQEGINVVDSDENIVFINQAFADFMGYHKEELIGMNLSQITDKDVFAKMREETKMRKKGKMSKYEIKLYTKAGEPRYFILSAVPIFEGKTFTGSLGLLSDITGRKQAEIKLQHTLKDLERSNTELKHFAYIASHDLQEPLRMVTSYVQLLQRRYQGKFDTDADEFIEFAVDGTARMQQMINDLLTYSRVGTRGESFAPTDCETVLKQALTNLKIAIQESGAIVTNNALPTVMADATQLMQLFQNLISNAIKFRSDEPPHIHIAAQPKENEWVFSVRDNGIGIEPAEAERIFMIFQRLHTKTEYPGTGIGLAVCKKIVERHGGRIWVESEPGDGSYFYFTIPISQKIKKEI